MGVFDPKVVKWYRKLMDAIYTDDGEKVSALLSEPAFKLCIDFKTGMIAKIMQPRLESFHHWTHPSRYQETDIGVFIITYCGASHAWNTLSKFFLAEATPEAKSRYLRTAAGRASVSLIEKILQNGADPDMTDIAGRTPLHVAAQAGRAESVSALIAGGADPRIKDKQMNTAADYAEVEKHHGIANYLREQMARHSAKSSQAQVQVTAKAAAPATEAQDDGDWRLISKHEIACVSEKPQIGYRITEIFNFQSSLYTQIALDTARGQQSQFVLTFDALSRTPGLLEDVARRLEEKGGAVAQAPTQPQPVRRVSIVSG